MSALCLRSKAYWGYDAAFLASVAPYLKVTEDAIGAGHATVAQSADGDLLGVCQIDHAKAQLKALGQTVMTILSDPYAEPAYLHMGARRIEMRSSDVFPGRELPWLEVSLR